MEVAERILKGFIWIVPNPTHYYPPLIHKLRESQESKRPDNGLDLTVMSICHHLVHFTVL